jgi:fatty acid hydroxylase domain-containing protein 2
VDGEFYEICWISFNLNICITQAPIALTAAYAHPIEHVFSNIIPVIVGPLVMGSHLITTWIWILWVTSETLTAHSGYHLPFLPVSPEAHDFHHLK